MLLRHKLPTRPHYLRLLVRQLRTQPLNDYQEPDTSYAESQLPAYGLATPREVCLYLNQFIVGQENAKKVLSVAVYNHYNRVRANLSILEQEELERDPEFDGSIDPASGVSSARVRPMRRPTGASFRPTRRVPLFEKSNILVIGPTGSGKTLLAKTLARVLDVPFSVSDATSFTQAGYVGEDVDMAIQRLLQAANWDPVRASMGIVYIDEIDKIARKTGGVGTDTSRDVGGEGVQQALLRMMEGSVVSVQAKSAGVPEPPVGAGAHPRSGQRAPHLATAKPDVYHIDTSNVLFILSGAFVGLEDIIKQRTAKGSIGFTANLSGSRSFELPRQLPFFTSNRNPSNVLSHLETSDLIKFGFIPEFISRIPSVTTLSPLTVSDLRRILTDVKGSLISQYQALFGYSGVEIRFTTAALDEICRKAAERGGGARGLRGIMVLCLYSSRFSLLTDDICHVLITEDVVQGAASPRYWKKNQGVAFWEAWAAEENKNGAKS
ncbi:ATP-dependent Clp protease ATP-binding subunit ClpX [Leucoagaricus sp. SymC.cos]|nr:ATP-dependent Clp protease ATP-binding subunit ClpX [Leucoagaricus sp. SymC.cos]